MADQTFLTWPFFEDRHRDYTKRLEAWVSNAVTKVDHSDTDVGTLCNVSSVSFSG